MAAQPPKPTLKPPPPPLPTPAKAPSGAPRDPGATGGPNWQQLFAPAPDSTQAPRVSICYAGLPKRGKTHCAVTWPKPVVLNFDPNLATVRGLGVPYINLNSTEGYRIFQTEIVPALFHRRIDGLISALAAAGWPDYQPETFVIDTLSFLAPHLQAAIPVPQSARGAEDYLAWYGLIKTAWENLLGRLSVISQPYPGDPSRSQFNLVCNTHIALFEHTEGTGRDARLVPDGWFPLLEGKFREKAFAYFDTVINVDLENRAQGTPQAGQQMQVVTEFVGYSKGKTALHTAGDGVGGIGKRYRELPKRIVNPTYPTLAKLWGFPGFENSK